MGVAYPQPRCTRARSIAGLARPVREGMDVGDPRDRLERVQAGASPTFGAGAEARYPHGRAEGTAMDTTVDLHTEFIRLGALLKLADIVQSGGEAKLLIQDGYVSVNDAIETRRGAKIRPGDRVRLALDETVTIEVRASGD